MEDLLDYEMEQYDIMSPVGITFGAFQVDIYWMMYIQQWSRKIKNIGGRSNPTNLSIDQ